MSDQVGVGFNGTEFKVKVPFFMNGLAKNAPDRTWDKNQKLWVLPDSKANRRYIKKHFEWQWMSDAVKVAVSEEEPEQDFGFFPADWEFPVPPMKHQLDACRWAWELPACALFHEMGLGKTYTAINLAGARWNNDLIDAVLVICPTSIKSVWEKEFRLYGSEAAPPVVHVHQAGTNRQTEEFIQGTQAGMKVLVVGSESLSSAPAKRVKTGKWEYDIAHSNSGRYAKWFVDTRRVMVIVDESSDIKNAQALRTEAAWDIADRAMFKIIMTGTDITQGLHDLYGQFRFLDWEIIGQKSYFTFRAKYCILEPVPGAKGNAKRIVGYQNVPDLMDSIRPFVHQRLKKDCLDLPDKVYEERSVVATTEQRKAVRDLKTAMMAEVKGKKIEIKMALDFLLRCQQIAGGFMPYTTGETDKKGKLLYFSEALDKNPKLDELMRILEGVPQATKVIIWCRFQKEIEEVCDRINEEIGMARMFYGPVTPENRAKITENFQNPDHPLRFMVATQAVGGMGQTWTAATLVIYYSQSFSYKDRIQSEDRAHRKGQTNKVTYIDLTSNLKVDRRVRQVLEQKGEMATFVDEAMAQEIMMEDE